MVSYLTEKYLAFFFHRQLNKLKLLVSGREKYYLKIEGSEEFVISVVNLLCIFRVEFNHGPIRKVKLRKTIHRF